MKRQLSILKIKIILILVVITPSIAIISYLLFIQSPNIVYHIVNYFNSQETMVLGSDFGVDIFWFLPDNLKFISLTLSQILDVLIIICIIFHIQFPLFPTLKQYNLIKDPEYAFDYDLYHANCDKSENNSNMGQFEHNSNTNMNSNIINKIENYNRSIQKNRYVNNYSEKIDQKHNSMIKKLNYSNHNNLFYITNLLNCFNNEIKNSNSSFSYRNSFYNKYYFFSQINSSSHFFYSSLNSSYIKKDCLLNKNTINTIKNITMKHKLRSNHYGI